MVKINRTPLPPEITITKEDDYQNGPVHDILEHDFYGKCYICEDGRPTSIQTDHLHSHKGKNDILKYDWNNLFYSCGHCNHAKMGHYDNIIDCTQIDPEDFIGLSLENDIKITINVEKLRDTAGLDETIALLDRVYNGESRSILKSECLNLRKKVLDEVQNFQNELYEYQQENDVELRSVYLKRIPAFFDRKTAFAAFKRGIIRNNHELFLEFGNEL